MARPALSDEPSVRQQLVMPPELIRQIDKWRRRYVVDSRSEAIRQLCEIALIYDPNPAVDAS
jgi:metal-responsive CopG/Arc/MetJ family transcriptional regulator